MTSAERLATIERIDELLDRLDHGERILLTVTNDVDLVTRALTTYETVLNMIERYDHEKN